MGCPGSGTLPSRAIVRLASVTRSSLADDFAMFKDMVLGRLPW
jgi:hypothetical protein